MAPSQFPTNYRCGRCYDDLRQAEEHGLSLNEIAEDSLRSLHNGTLPEMGYISSSWSRGVS
jgi:predicted hydrolase (HD superfamily)